MFRILAIIFALFLTSCGGEMKANPPKVKKILHETKLADGSILKDYYHWMQDKGWPDEVNNKDAINHLKAENKYVDDYFSHTKQDQQKLYEEMKGRIKLDDQSTYVKKGDYFYYTRNEFDKSYKIYCRKKGSMDSGEEIILDVNELAKNQKYTVLGSVSVSNDNKLLAYSIDFSGDEKYEIRILNLETGKYLEDKIGNTAGNIVWHKKESGFFYPLLNDKQRPDSVYFHKLGDDSKNDRLIYKEKDETFWLSISRTSSNKFLTISMSNHGSSEKHILSLEDNSFKTFLVKERKPEIVYNISHHGDYIYLQTNDKGSNMRIIRAPYSDMNPDNWKSYIDLDEEKYLESFAVTENYMMLNYKYLGLNQIKILNIKESTAKIIDFPDAAYTAGAYTTNFEEDDIRVDYSSPIRPNTTYSYDFVHGKLEVLKQQEVLGGYNPDEYEVERIWADNKGTKVPISLLYRKDLFKKDGSNPLFQVGYGSYGIEYEPSFSMHHLSLVNRGFVYAIAHVRGGNDLGFHWYEDGKLLNKKNTFEDFVACSEHLIDQQYTSKGKIVTYSGSAGGLLVGVSANMRPDLYGGVLIRVPFVDLIGTMLDDSQPLTVGEYKEWGNPNEVKYLQYMKSYSPYDNVSKQLYPSFFITVGLYDPRVAYWEGAKWAAKLREYSASNNPIFLRVNMGAGHFGSSDRFDFLKEYAEQFIYVLDAVGKKAY